MDTVPGKKFLSTRSRVFLFVVVLAALYFGVMSLSGKVARDDLRSVFVQELDLMAPGLMGDLPFIREPRGIGVDEPSRNVDGVLSGPPGATDRIHGGVGPGTQTVSVNAKALYLSRVHFLTDAGWRPIEKSMYCSGAGRLPQVSGRFLKIVRGQQYSARLFVNSLPGNTEYKDLRLPNGKYPPITTISISIGRGADDYVGVGTPNSCDGFDGTWPVGEFAKLVSESPPPPPLERQPNCEYLRFSYARGVGRKGIVDKSENVVINPGSYQNNKHLDFDNDGIACEDGQLKDPKRKRK
jgi:Excalibur calcium-binding domain